MCPWWSASLLQSVAKASFQLLRMGMETERVSGVVGQLLEALPNHRLRLVGEVMSEVMRVAWLEAQDTDAARQGAGQEHAAGAAASLRSAIHQLVQCCLRRLESSESAYENEEQDPAPARAEEAAERLVTAAASVGYDALVMVAQEVCDELEAAARAAGDSKGSKKGSKGDLSRLGAALSLAQAMAVKPRALAAALHMSSHGHAKAGGLSAVTKALTGVLTALEEHAQDFAPGKRQLQHHAVAAHAKHCLSVLSAIKRPLQEQAVAA